MLFHCIVESHFDNYRLPLVIASSQPGADLNAYIIGEKERLNGLLLDYGGILFRNFEVRQTRAFRKVAETWSKHQVNYFDQTSPRSLIDTKIYTSTDHPSDQVIHMHNELSYSFEWPLQIIFFCEQPAENGGETPIADSRGMLEHISNETLDRFSDKGVMYIRNMIKGMGLSWQEVYQTESMSEVEKHCANHGISFEWIDEDHLRTKWVRPALRKHPVTNQKIWFNHALFYNKYLMNPGILDAIDSQEDLPFSTYYGDGTEIEPDTIHEIQNAYRKATTTFTWERGDVLLLDNMLASHGRNSFRGKRKVAVAMFEPMSDWKRGY
ncbi:MAG: TauD/TfdA family dioxygenase [Bacteroidota bacterium]